MGPLTKAAKAFEDAVAARVAAAAASDATPESKAWRAATSRAEEIAAGAAMRATPERAAYNEAVRTELTVRAQLRMAIDAAGIF